ncbi:MAG: hypothetical protein A2086_03270 [Spirochaetes bacterium GWD1_27_9]|nr:MAG: hypothetical protein A2Z98_12945 [Spirochaetes bacterium GWB1_27_13]OHD26839.1 MAG: hypothetical protein A2Y34_15740 [Spirochaetes bacterium GWC1_27_15]OHD38718.1 MAG: hypothetical protein A2086_03270 [Spirochaetes bacterium GWD1_27_9]
MLQLESDKIEDYLQETEIINFSNQSIQKISKQFDKYSHDEILLVKHIYEYVRDNISHSFDIPELKKVTCIASDVLENGEGICFAKAHLLAALLRSKNIPTGFTYQKVYDEEDKCFFLHGLNTVYLKSINKWIRLDARGNNKKKNIKAEFSIDHEILAYPVRKEFGEDLFPVVSINPDIRAINCLKQSLNREQVYNNAKI